MNRDGKNVILTAIPCVTNNLKLIVKESNNNTNYIFYFIKFDQVYYRNRKSISQIVSHHIESYIYIVYVVDLLSRKQIENQAPRENERKKIT